MQRWKRSIRVHTPPPSSETVAAVSSNVSPYRSNFPQRGRGVASRGRGASNVSSSNRPITCFLCKANHFVRDCPYKAKTVPKGHCGACAGSGHWATHHAKMPPSGWPFNAELQCFRFKGRGHSKKECPSQFNNAPTTQTQAYFGKYDKWHEWQEQDENRDWLEEDTSINELSSNQNCQSVEFGNSNGNVLSETGHIDCINDVNVISSKKHLIAKLPIKGESLRFLVDSGATHTLVK